MADNFGKLTVRAYTANGGLPTADARVVIRGAQENNRDVYYELITDKDGNTSTVVLPTPDVDYSLSPSPDSIPYALYDVEIVKEGYYSKKIYGLSVFTGINSLQLINMIPMPEGGTANYPLGGLDTVIPKNDRL